MLHLVSAVEFEIAPLISLLKQKRLEFSTFEFGIGPLAASRKFSLLEKSCEKKDVIYVGTCGDFSGFSGIQLVSAERTVFLPTCERHNLSWSIEGLYPPISLESSSFITRSLTKKTVVTSPNISKTNLLPPGFVPKDCVENLELYAVAEAVKSSARSFAVVLATTNAISEKARAEWRQNYQEAARLSAQYIVDHLNQKTSP